MLISQLTRFTRKGVGVEVPTYAELMLNVYHALTYIAFYVKKIYGKSTAIIAQKFIHETSG